MITNQELKQNLEIKAFKDRILKIYGVKLFVYMNVNTNYDIDLEVMGKCTLKAIKTNHIEYRNINSLTVRKRPRSFLIYIQALSYIAYKNGYSKSSIGLYLNRTHATVINSIKMVENALFTNDKKILKTLDNILKEIEHVGTIPENFKSKPEPKSNIDPIWDEARHFIASHFTE
jgi:hypothetical protein